MQFTFVPFDFTVKLNKKVGIFNTYTHSFTEKKLVLQSGKEQNWTKRATKKTVCNWKYSNRRNGKKLRLFVQYLFFFDEISSFCSVIKQKLSHWNEHDIFRYGNDVICVECKLFPVSIPSPAVAGFYFLFWT